jgi:hypothetical protein
MLAVAGIAAGPTLAQRQPDSVGLGIVAGNPSGLTVKQYRPGLVAYELLLTTDVDDFVRLALHRVWERPLPESPLYVVVGPGLAAGLHQLDRGATLRAAVSGTAGLNFYAERFEVFLHVTPRLRFLPTLRPDLGGGVGLRYYF